MNELRNLDRLLTDVAYRSANEIHVDAELGLRAKMPLDRMLAFQAWFPHYLKAGLKPDVSDGQLAIGSADFGAKILNFLRQLSFQLKVFVVD